MIFDNLNEPMMILDLDFRIVNCNQAMASLVGMTRGELLSRSCCAIVHDRNQPPANCPLRKVILSQKREIVHQKVGTQWFNVVVDPVFNLEGEFVGAVHVMYDITAQEALRTRDVLTSLYNRQFFEAELAKTEPGRSRGVILCDIDGLKLINDSLGFEQGNKLLVNVAEILLKAAGTEGVVARIGEDSFGILLKGCTEEEVASYCLKIRISVNGFNADQGREFLSLSLGYTYSDDSSVTPEMLFSSAYDVVYRQKLLSTKSVRNATTMTIKRLLEARDFNTGQHSDRSQELVMQLASNMGLSERSIDNLRLLGRFHDIGKIGVSDSILLKPGGLTAEEFQLMTKHCEIGYHVASSLPDVAHIADFILKHHERWDGNGYPLKLKGEQIPIECRIMAVVDSYDAMVSDRPYRKAMKQDQAISELQRCSGTQFDPQITREFIKLLHEVSRRLNIYAQHNGELNEIA